MKQASILLAFCVLLSITAVAQSQTGTPAQVPSPALTEKKTQRITIVTKKTDDNGQTITETYIAEGEKPEEILQKMAISPEVMQKVDLESLNGQENEETLFLFRSAGDQKVVKGTLNEDAIAIDDKKVVVFTTVEEGTGKTESQKIMTVVHQGDKPGTYYYKRGQGEKSNCAALGVYVQNDHSDTWGARINSIIDKGGAQEAGLQEGDILKNIDEFDISDYPSLHLALSHFMPGDQVKVRYEREGKTNTVVVTLKGWDQLPGFEYKSRSECKPELQEKPKDEDPLLDDPDGLSFVPEIKPLELEDARIYPNPTDGIFSLSFKTKAAPTSIVITDGNGKTVYEEDLRNFAGVYTNEINIRDFPQGNYVISVKQGDQVFSRLISKQ